MLLHWDGQAWSQAASPTNHDLRGLVLSPDGTGWAVGADGVILHWNGQAWTQTASPTSQNLNAVWSDSCEGGLQICTWAVGDGGTVLRYTNSAWMIYPQTVTSENLLAISGSSTSSARIGGASGALLAYLYGNWIPYPGFTAGLGSLNAVMTDTGNNIWTAGEDGAIRFSGYTAAVQFGPLPLPASAPIRSLAYQHGRQQWAVGDGGLLLSGELSGWKKVSLPITATLRSVAAVPYGALRLPAGKLPDVIIQDAITAAPVYTAPLGLSFMNWYNSGEDIYTFDFSRLTAPGRYRAYLPGLGISDLFSISEHALDFAAYTSMRLPVLPAQRDGPPNALRRPPFCPPGFI